MKPIMLGLLAGVVAGYVHGTAAGQVLLAPDTSATAPVDKPTITLEALLNPQPKVAAAAGANGLRARMINDAGQTVGFRAGMANRAKQLAKNLNIRAPELDVMYQFSTLMRSDGTIPPVIVEATDVASFSTDQFRVAAHVYRIEKEERFVSVPPTWRNYLLAGLSVKGEVELPIAEARPHGENELAIWRDAVRSGWAHGEKEADAVLAANFGRLTRDYTGMILYSQLLATGMILPTRVAQSSRTVSGDTQQLVLNDTSHRLVAKARFETDSDKWIPVISGAPDNVKAATEPGIETPVSGPGHN